MIKQTVLAIGLLQAFSISAETALPKVTTSIKPVSMVVKAVAGEYADIQQVVGNNASPHDFALRPSDIRKINQADAVVWVGESLESFLEKSLENAGKLDNAIEWLALDGVTLASYSEHDHDKHDDHKGHDHHDEHDHHNEHDEHKGHDHHDEHDHHYKHDERKGHDHHGHNHGEFDPHVWLSPDNAIVLAKAVAHRLSELAPSHHQHYQANLANFIDAVEKQEQASKNALKALADVKYIVFHDAYHYFEEHNGIYHAAEVAINPERKPGAKKVAQLRHLIEDDGVSCIYAEPQFSDAIIHSLTEDLSVKIAMLDPLGSDITLSETAYVDFLEALTQQFLACKS
ncbi:zinc ABC transporter substrate-binding protein [Marinomonas agarivorans]|nr:zinc ABC transporter substrate-binding protein [Marinomonas agarivorans]